MTGVNWPNSAARSRLRRVANATEKRIYRLAATCGLLAALALVVPRFVPNQEGGFASAATAILVFLGILSGAAIASLYLLFVTVQVYREISLVPRLAGIGPSVILITTLALLLGFLSY
jgi:hypothetical protein